jgi:Flp pilus assembly protein TadG
MVELALALPLLLLAIFYAFALLDAAATQEGVEAGARRAASVLAGSNDDAQATGAAMSGPWVRGQAVSITFSPDGAQRRCSGTPVTITFSAPGHLGFLLPAPLSWSATRIATIENAGAQQRACGGAP